MDLAFPGQRSFMIVTDTGHPLSFRTQLKLQVPSVSHDWYLSHNYSRLAHERLVLNHHCNIVDWEETLAASWKVMLRFLIGPLDFSSDLILLVALWPRGQLSL
jgi:hypothetical protein